MVLAVLLQAEHRQTLAIHVQASRLQQAGDKKHWLAQQQALML